MSSPSPDELSLDLDFTRVVRCLRKVPSDIRPDAPSPARAARVRLQRELAVFNVTLPFKAHREDAPDDDENAASSPAPTARTTPCSSAQARIAKILQALDQPPISPTEFA